MTSRDVFERKLAMVDFDPIMYKLVRSDDGPRWTLTRAQQVERWYRKYHILFFLFPNEIIVPTVEVDDFWHQHILDTKKYADDCTFLHGRFIHHFPYLGLRGPADRQLLKDAFLNTLKLCEAVFDESPAVLRIAFANSEVIANGAGLCGGGCNLVSENSLQLEFRPSLSGGGSDGAAAGSSAIRKKPPLLWGLGHFRLDTFGALEQRVGGNIKSGNSDVGAP